MNNWYLLYCQTQKFDLVVSRISSLGVTCYYPLEIVISTRTDRPSMRVKRKPLFPGYLFVYFDPEVIHTTTIAEVPGAHQFIRFGGMPSIVDENVIESFKGFQQIRENRELETIECINLPKYISDEIINIYNVKNCSERSVLLMNLVERWQKVLPTKLQAFSTLSTY